MTSRSLILVSLSLVLLGGCAQFGMQWMAEAASPPRIEAQTPGAAVPWTGLEPLDAPEAFHFAVVSDRTGGHRANVFASAMPKLNLLQPAFVLSVGDLIEGYTADRARLSKEWDEIEGFVDGLRMPFFYAAGNHDMSNEVMAETWQERFGPSYYHFRYKGVLFVMMNSELFGMVHDPRSPVPGPWTQADQMAWVEGVLAENSDARWTFVVVHQPLWDSPQIHPDWLRVEELLGDRGYTVFAGHTHRYTRHVRRGRQFITLATTGGGSAMRGLPWGEFDHVAFVHMNGEEPVIANVTLDGVQDTDVLTADLRVVVDALAGAVVALPMRGNGRTFREGVARFEVTNSLERPLELEARFSSGRDLRPDVTEAARSLPPGAVEVIEVPLRSRLPLRYEELAPAKAHFILRTQGPGGEPVEIERELAMVPDGHFGVATLDHAVTVDGDLSEWGRLRFVVDQPATVEGHGEYGGASDASFRFDLRRDETHLYVAVDVTDDSVVSSSDRIARDQDAVLISIDPRPKTERNENGGLFDLIRSGGLARMVSAMVTVEEPREDPILALFTGGVEPVDVHASRRTAQGYTVELVVPVAALHERAGGQLDGLRVNLTVEDYDEGEADHNSLYWRPSRFEAGTAKGVGSFDL
ncbi:MAG: metallophosphoesterase [Deltaproteobacteria bacterium]|nr:metallophosphoesterase [Deltaproteobacteria bacterium]